MVSEIRDPEGLAAHLLPATLVNKAYAYFDGTLIRLVFADQGAPDWPAAPRASVAMHPALAAQVAKALASMAPQQPTALVVAFPPREPEPPKAG